MKFNKNLAAIHGYLCADGYVIKNPSSQKHKYYYIGLRNTNQTLLKDFQQKFKLVFGIKPIITNEGRCKIQNKEIYNFLTKNFSYYSYEWKLPKFSKENLSYWLRAFFDCEGWVENYENNFSRMIRVESCNRNGLLEVQEELQRFSIKSTFKKKLNRTIWRLTICGISNFKIFYKHIGFLHPQKSSRLSRMIDSYKGNWNIPSRKDRLLSFIMNKGKVSKNINQISFNTTKIRNMIELKKSLNKHGIKSKLFGPWINKVGLKYYYIKINYLEVNI